MKHAYFGPDKRVPIPEGMRRPFVFDASVIAWLAKDVKERNRREPKRLNLFTEHRLQSGLDRGSFGA